MRQQIRFNKEAAKHYMNFAVSHQAKWHGNFRDLSASVTRMATLAQGGRISLPIVETEIDRLKKQWGGDEISGQSLVERYLSPEILMKIDLFDRMQLDAVIRVCCESRSLSEAGRRLFDVSLTTRTSANDADRLRKYLSRFGLAWNEIKT